MLQSRLSTAPPGIVFDVRCPHLSAIPRSPSIGSVIRQRRAAIHRWRWHHANCLSPCHHCPNHRPTPPILRLIVVSSSSPPLGIAVPVTVAVAYTVAVPVLVAGDDLPYDNNDNKDDGVLSMVTHCHCHPINVALPLPSLALLRCRANATSAAALTPPLLPPLPRCPVRALPTRSQSRR